LIASSGFPANKYTVARNTGETLRETPVIDIRAMIEVCALLSGFGRDLEDRETSVIVAQLVQNKGYLKNAEIKAAFDCAFNGDLDIKPDDLKPYGQFSWLYVSRIIFAYEKKVQEGKLIQDLSLPIEKVVATPEEIEVSKRYVIDRIIEQFTRTEDHDFGPLGNTDLNIINMVYDCLKGLGYNLGEHNDLKDLYNKERENEYNRRKYWMKRKEIKQFADYKCIYFMNRPNSEKQKNIVHREVAKRCRHISVLKFYDECKQMDFDLVTDVLDRFNSKNKYIY